MKAIPAALYLRVSTTKQDEENQRALLESLCAARGWTVIDIYRDVETGGNPGRTGFNRLQHDLRIGRVRAVAFWSWDRITRGGVKETFAIMESWKLWRNRWESLQEPFLSNADEGTAELLLAIIGWSAKQQRLRISENTKAGMERRRNLGIHVGRPKGARDKRPRRRKIAEAST